MQRVESKVRQALLQLVENLDVVGVCTTLVEAMAVLFEDLETVRMVVLFM